MATRTEFAERPRAGFEFPLRESAQAAKSPQLDKDIRPTFNPFETGRKSARRDRVQILLKMLQAAESPIRKTHLMYGAGINFYQLEKHLSFLIGSGMIEEIEQEDSVAFRTTSKGRMFSQMFS